MPERKGSKKRAAAGVNPFSSPAPQRLPDAASHVGLNVSAESFAVAAGRAKNKNTGLLLMLGSQREVEAGSLHFQKEAPLLYFFRGAPPPIPFRT